MCPRCGSALEASPSVTPISATSVFGAPPLVQAGDAGPSSMPLTFGQKARLIVDCLPLLFFTLALVFTMTFFDDIYGAPPPAALLLFLGVIILITGYQALQRMRDLTSGVALVQEDLLQRFSGTRGQGRHRWGTFAQLGKLSLTPKAYHQGQPGRRHRVVYSPASRIVWSLEPLDYS
jgi:hypothetical protein